MSSVPVSKARTELKELVNRVAYGKERIFLTSYNKQMVAIVPLEDLRILEEIEAREEAEDARIIKKRRKDSEGTISLKEMKKRLKLNA